MFVLPTVRPVRFFSKKKENATCLHMIGPDKLGKAEGRDSNDSPFSLEFWLDRAGDGNLADQEKQRKTGFLEFYLA